MKYKALFLDIDGTTVVHGVQNLPSIRVTNAIREARKKNSHMSCHIASAVHFAKNFKTPSTIRSVCHDRRDTNI